MVETVSQLQSNALCHFCAIPFPLGYYSSPFFSTPRALDIAHLIGDLTKDDAKGKWLRLEASGTKRIAERMDRCSSQGRPQTQSGSTHASHFQLGCFLNRLQSLSLEDVAKREACRSGIPEGTDSPDVSCCLLVLLAWLRRTSLTLSLRQFTIWA